MTDNQPKQSNKTCLLRVAVVGFGYLGRFHAEKYKQLPNVKLTAICDTDHACLMEAQQRFHVLALSDYRELFGQVDAVNIVVPTSQHYEIAKDFLIHGIHVLLEKPMTTTVAQADSLINIAQHNKVHLQIGHLERFNPTMQLLTRQQTQAPYHITCQRLSPFNTRGTDVNVILDLMIHDLDLILQFIHDPITRIQVNGSSLITDHIDMANVWLTFEHGHTAHLYANRVSEQTKRQLRFYYDQHYMIADLRNKTLQKYHTNTSYNTSPQLVNTQLPVAPEDALYQQLAAFIQAITQKKPVAVSGQEGRQALAISLQITDLIQQKIAAYKINPI